MYLASKLDGLGVIHKKQSKPQTLQGQTRNEMLADKSLK